MNSRIPCSASSRPWPENFTPPKGSRGSEATILFRKTMPASSSLINLSVSDRIIRPGTGSQAEADVVGDLDGLVDIFYAKQRCHGPKKSSW